ncbi:DNA replication complex GINS protein SLD5 [Momordica charantia]|uniref:DNA replication complex GINS protein SLD5 n=1 Tax=Momordica charantia TaxID=3673 RepID=A0A6J1D0B0_MOMCH|nr:DNA replication complex GINS protein SLD5 [Momordica charantia]
MMASSLGGATMSQTDDFEASTPTNDVEPLKRAWRNEKAAPEILPFEASLIGRIKEQIQLMEETIEEYSRSGIDPLIVSLYQMDLDRTQFLLRSYIRIRLQKIEKYMLYMLKSDELFGRLSEEERVFAERCCHDVKSHFDESVLSKLPNNYQSILRQSIISEEDDMVPEPPLDTFVVCKSKEYLEHIQLEDEDERASSRLEEPFEMEANVLHIIRYKPIKSLVESGRIDLL